MYLSNDEEDETSHYKKKKNTKKWCKGKVGREHVLEITRSNYAFHLQCNYPKWGVIKDGIVVPLGRYVCWHQRSCQKCGKVIEWTIPKEECPDYKESNA